MRGNEGWHTDSSYMPLAAKASVLSAQVVPTVDGETEWADMRAAYDALDEATRRRIAGLSAHHSLYYSQAKIGHVVEKGAAYGFHTKGAPLRPLVKVHPSRRPLLVPFGLKLETDELGSFRAPVVVAPIGVNQPERVVPRSSEDRGGQSSFVVHAPSVSEPLPLR